MTLTAKKKLSVAAPEHLLTWQRERRELGAVCAKGLIVDLRNEGDLDEASTAFNSGWGRGVAERVYRRSGLESARLADGEER